MEGELYTSPELAERPAADRALTLRAEAFVESLDRLAPFPIDPPRRSELITEAATVLDAFGRAADPVGVREALALAGLLGRRSAELGASAVELAAVVEALLAVVGDTLSSTDRQGLRGLVLEGYTRALLERDREMQLDARVRVTRPFVIAPRTVMHVLQGSADGDWIAGASESLGPLLLHADARSIVVVAQLDGDVSGACLAELSALVDVANVVGARVVFACNAALAEALRARVGERASLVVDDTTAAVAEALSHAATSPTDAVRARVAGLLKRLGV